MKAIISGVEQNIKLTSHILEADPENPNVFLIFHCWQCGQKLMQFSGYEVMEVPGPKFSSLPVIVLCKVCKRRHLFSSIL